jgi:hypothetical protein
MAELLRILRITTIRVRTPAQKDNVWDIRVVKRQELKPRGSQPKGLTPSTSLLAMRDKGNDVYEFTLPEAGGAYSQGEFELCKEADCAGQYSLRWLKHPIYSADGSQCVLADFSNLGEQEPSAYVALVRVNNKP